MNRPIIIVDPRSSGTELAPAFKARGIPTIAITFPTAQGNHRGFGTKIQIEDFDEVIPNQPHLSEILKKYNPLAIIPGADGGVALADSLAEVLTPQFANAPEKALHRLHKAHMQQALEDARVPSLKTLNTSCERDVETWLKHNDLLESSLIIKPPMSAGSDKVFHIPAKGDWRKAFARVLTEPSILTGQRNETAVVQEEALGSEFAIGTVSSNGQHYLAHLIKYNKTSADDRKTVFDHVEFLAYNNDKYGEIFDYTKKVLDALGIRWGAAHTEVILTKNGPRLIETGARMLGGPTVGFARTATGSSQADKLVEVYADGDVANKNFVFRKTVVPVFLRSPATGVVSNAEVFDEIYKLGTLLKPFLWFKNGDIVPHTVDYLTSIGIIALTGDRESIFADYKAIRTMESKLVVLKD
ncbi:MAG: ATP-grasp domain-containing protein [Bdellovibrio sp.]